MVDFFLPRIQIIYFLSANGESVKASKSAIFHGSALSSIHYNIYRISALFSIATLLMIIQTYSYKSQENNQGDVITVCRTLLGSK
jgi:hypothetical protein